MSVEGIITTSMAQAVDPDALVAELFAAEARSLVRLARVFCDDRNAAEDLVQEAFIRLHRNASTIRDRDKAPAFLRSIVINMARDANRRGLMSLRHRDTIEPPPPAPSLEDEAVADESDQVVLGALRRLSDRQRSCLVLRFYLQLSEREIEATLSISNNSVKTHCKRGMAALELLHVEQRLLDALGSVDQVEPSTDLFARVLHSIDEDRLHRRRVMRSAAVLALTVGGVALAMTVSMIDGAGGRHVRWQTMEMIETLVLVIVVAVLGPAIRRFGRNYVADLWPADRASSTALLRLLDLAYVLVLTGFVLVTARFAEPALAEQALAEQLSDLGNRLGGVLLVIGVLHAITITSLPLVALVANSTRTGWSLPRWVVGLLAVLGAEVGFGLFVLITGLVGAGLS